jgi:flavin reductase (DIM6/NTAB) family NADH-FMN oxidoreductase RutF
MNRPRPDRYEDWDQLYTNLDPDSVRSTFQSMPAAVAAISAVVGDEPRVLVVSSFTVGVSFDPPMCSFAVQGTSTTWPALSRAPRLGVSILGAGHQGTVRQLASRDQARRFDGVDHTRLPSDAVMLYDSPLWLECRIAHDYEAGDHRLIVLEVLGSSVAGEHEPLLVHQTRFGTYLPR